MKKTISITIAGTIFYIEEDAYNSLRQYLDQVEAHFAKDPESAEIVGDIEARIAEQFSNRAGGSNSAVTNQDVERLIASMGKVEDFDDQSKTSTAETPAQEQRPHRLFRDPDDRIVAGVASGLGQYFSLDPWLVRIIFILLALAGASGFILYLVLALLVPEAKTPAEKIQMKGGPINLNSIAENAKKKFDEVDMSPARNFLNSIGRLVRLLVTLVLKLAGIFAGFMALALAVAATFAMVNLIFNPKSAYIDFAFAEVASNAVYYTMVGLGYIAAIIPLVFVILLAISLIKSRNVFTAKLGIPLIAIWFAAVVAMGAVWFRVGPEYEQKISELPRYQIVTQTPTVEEFDQLNIGSFTNVKLVQAEERKVTVTGRKAEIERLKFEVKNGVLMVKQEDNPQICIFCSTSHRAEITVSTPDLSAITLRNLATLESENFTADKLSLSLLQMSSAEMDLTLDELELSVHSGGHAELTGKVKKMDINASGHTRVAADSLLATTATVTATQVADVEVNVSDELTVFSRDAADVVYSGNPRVTPNVEDAASLQQQ